MTLRVAVLAFISALLLSSTAQAEVLFEAFYRIETSQKHTGYLIQRLAHDSKGHRVLSFYIRTRQGDQEFFITSKSKAKQGSGAPIETSYTSNFNGAPFTIDSKFKKDHVAVFYFSNYARKPSYTEKAKLAPIPSAFMYFLADLAQFQPGKKYHYTAYFEENAKTQIGQLSLLGAKDVGGKRVLQILNDDSAQPVETFVSESGQVLGSRNAANDTVVYWVASKNEAVGDLAFPTGELTKLFGDLPQGKKNEWSKQTDLKSSSIIAQFTTWRSDRSLSSSQVTGTLPLPLRKL